MRNNNKPIGIFDSGVGGLSVWKEIVKILPDENIIYYADSNNCPYGSKKQSEVIALSERIVDFLLGFDCKLIVVACNTATAAAIEYLRKKYTVPFVGMEPAVKPAALNTITGTIGILATQGTFQGKLFKETSRKWANGKKMIIQIGEGLVEQVEEGKVHSIKVKKLLKQYLQPMLDGNVDQIVLGCTHYPFLLEEIEKITKGKASVIDPAPAVAKRTYDLLKSGQLLNSSKSKTVRLFYINGKKEQMEKILKNISQEKFVVNFDINL